MGLGQPGHQAHMPSAHVFQRFMWLTNHCGACTTAVATKILFCCTITSRNRTALSYPPFQSMQHHRFRWLVALHTLAAAVLHDHLIAILVDLRGFVSVQWAINVVARDLEGGNSSKQQPTPEPLLKPLYCTLASNQMYRYSYALPFGLSSSPSQKNPRRLWTD